MIFNSLEFILFLLLVFILFWILPKKARPVVLLVASYIFYGFYNYKLIFLIFAVSLITYFSGLYLQKKENKKIKKAILTVTLIIIFGILFAFKYLPFLNDVYYDFLALLKSSKPRYELIIILPIGISFYILQTASYLIDIYLGKISAEKNFLFYLLFVSFFPQLVAGPIERCDDLLPQLRDLKNKNFKSINFSDGLRIMLIGFFKKIAIADMIGITVNNVYENLSSSNGLATLLATVLFAFQILCDFSGYCDIAVGVAKLFGVNLSENFNEPYKSTSIREFWTRWHITLSRWLRDYIYIPLGGSKKGLIRHLLNIFIVFLISGLWHGANYTFLIWGLLHASMQIIGILTLNKRNQLLEKMHLNCEGKFVKIYRTIITFLLVTFTFIFFRANNINDAFLAIKQIFSSWNINSDYIYTFKEVSKYSLFLTIFSVLAVLSILLLNRLKNLNKYKMFSNSIFRFLAYTTMTIVVVACWIYLQKTSIGSSFIYFEF